MTKTLCLSADEPNVNKNIKATIDSAVKGPGTSGLIDIGF